MLEFQKTYKMSQKEENKNYVRTYQQLKLYFWVPLTIHCNLWFFFTLLA